MGLSGGVPLPQVGSQRTSPYLQVFTGPSRVVDARGSSDPDRPPDGSSLPSDAERTRFRARGLRSIGWFLLFLFILGFVLTFLFSFASLEPCFAPVCALPFYLDFLLLLLAVPFFLAATILRGRAEFEQELENRRPERREAFLRAHPPPRKHELTAIFVVFLLITTGYLGLVWYAVSKPYCGPGVTGEGPPVTFIFGQPAPATSPDGRTYYDNLTVAFTVNQGSACPPAQIGTEEFGMQLTNWSASSVMPPTAAACSASQNFSSCNAIRVGWYSVLFDPASSPSVQSSYPSPSGSAWTSNAPLDPSGEKLSVVSSWQVAGTNALLSIFPTSARIVTGSTTL